MIHNNSIDISDIFKSDINDFYKKITSEIKENPKAFIDWLNN